MEAVQHLIDALESIRDGENLTSTEMIEIASDALDAFDRESNCGEPFDDTEYE